MRWLKLRLRLRRHPNAFELLPFLSNPYTGSHGHLLGEFHPITNHLYILLPWQSGLICKQPPNQGRRISNLETNSYFADSKEAVWQSKSSDLIPFWVTKRIFFAAQGG
jgi:hypothetical protein